MRRWLVMFVLATAPCAILASACLTTGLDDYAAGNADSGATGGGGRGPGTSSTGHEGGHGLAGSSSMAAGGGGDSSSSAGGAGGGCTVCGDACVDTQSDPGHCGACDVVCPGAYGCFSGVCGNVPVDVSAGLATCAVLRAGEVWCWGRDVWGEIGLDPASTNFASPFQSDRCQTSPIHVPGISGAVEVGIGSEFTCARTGLGDVYCWGKNPQGTLGHDPSTDPVCTKADSLGPQGPCSFTPQKVVFPTGVVAAQLAVGSNTVCVRTTGNDVYCWGNNGDGAVGAPVGGFAALPVKNANVNGDAADVSVSATAEGFSTVCVARVGTGAVACWGQAVSFFPLTPAQGDPACTYIGAIGPCTPVARPVPAQFATGAGAVFADRLAVGYLAACALRAGVVTCWGDNGFGERGNGTVSSSAFDPTVVALPVTAGLSGSFATVGVIDAAGTAMGFGWNASAQVGDGAFDGLSCHGGSACIAAPAPLPGLTGLAKISAGGQNGAAITQAGKVLMWGSNYTGEAAHAPGDMGDTPCGAGLSCHPAPVEVQGLP